MRFEKLQLEGLFKVNEYSLEPKSKLRCQLEDIVVVMQNNLDRCWNEDVRPIDDRAECGKVSGHEGDF